MRVYVSVCASFLKEEEKYFIICNITTGDNIKDGVIIINIWYILYPVPNNVIVARSAS